MEDSALLRPGNRRKGEPHALARANLGKPAPCEKLHGGFAACAIFGAVTSRLSSGAIVILICLMAAPVSSQETQAPDGAQRTRTGQAEPPSILPLPTPPLTAYPLELLGLLGPQAQRGPITLIPSIAVSEEYTDNLFQNNNDRQSDFITGFSPALTLLVNRPSYQISAGYSFTSEIYAIESRFSGPFNRQGFVGNSLFRLTPQLTLTALDTFLYDRNGNITSQRTTGRQESWTNTFTPGVAWQATAQSLLSVNATYTALRFPGGGTGLDSDTYQLQGTFAYTFTPRFTGTVGYRFTYLDLERSDNSTTHTPTLGFIYRLTPTLTAALSGGPAITDIRGETFITPYIAASLTKQFQWVSATIQYNRDVSTAGGFGGTTDTQTASGTLAVFALRGLTVAFTPAYTKSESVSNRQAGQVDVQSFSLGLSALYQIARYVGVFAGYNFLHERTGNSSSQQADIDQNRVRIGVQFGYPFNFD